MDLARSSDIFLTNFMPDARAKLRIDIEDIREANPDIIYVRGSGFGSRGPDSGKAGFDGTAFWARGGSAHGVTPDDADRPLFMPAGAYGDSMSGLALAGGIAAALFSRERTGQTSVVDVSLLSVGAWAMALSVNLSLLSGAVVPSMSTPQPGPARNPIHGSFRAADGRWLQLSMLQAGRYWADFCRHLDREDLIDDPRFASHDALMANAPAAHAIVAAEIAARPLAEWVNRFRDLEGSWAPLQNSLEVARDPQLRANGYISELLDADGNKRRLLANPVQFDQTPATLSRAPQFAEHTDDVLRELGLSEEQILALKIEGAVT
jgi:crotonobetainyl-CoA:carnitine CoA-transferase CaiB-like acyl-CoA transferase